MRIYIIIICVLGIFMLPNLVSAQTQIDIDGAVREAVGRLENTLSGTLNTGTSDSFQIDIPPARVTRGGRQPNWVDDPYLVYNRNNFIAAIGSGSNRNEAEARAFAALASFFGQSIRSEFTMTENYSEAVNRGVVSVSQNTRINNEITMAASMDKLIGAEIGNIWDSGRGTVFAAAFMNKPRTISIYSDMIIINNRSIELLTTMNLSEKNTFDGYARFRLAAQIAGINENYAAVISQAGGLSAGSVSALNMRRADSLNLEAANIIRNITINIHVINDHANRIQDAFAKALVSEGLRTRGNNPQYTLEVSLSLSEVTFPGNNYIHCRIEVSANLIKNSTGASLLSFNLNERTFHNTYANAQNAALILAERIIAQKYPDLLREYLSSLIPIN